MKIIKGEVVIKKKPEGGVLVNNEDSRKNVNVNVSKLIDFYNSLSTV